ADEPAWVELGVAVGSDPRQRITLPRLVYRDPDVLFFGPDERPNLVRLDALAWQVAEHGILVVRRSLSKSDEEPHHGPLRCAGHPAGRADRVALDQRPDHYRALVARKAVH